MAASGSGESIATRHRLVVLGCTMLATLMQALDNTIANVALPHMQGSLGASRDQITWVLTSYVIAAAIFTAPVGWFAARGVCFGNESAERKSVFPARSCGESHTDGGRRRELHEPLPSLDVHFCPLVELQRRRLRVFHAR